jgi:hypothetical protein
MIMNGLLALASLYDDTPNDVESTFYHNKCIKLLIEAFAQPAEIWDSTLLTAVVIARLYEENDNETDSYYHHLSGTQNLLNHEVIARFVMQGGLAEAASWVHLRQVIYIYVVRSRPIPICLENFERSTVFRRCDDSAYANRAVYNFAKVMMLFLSMAGPDENQEGFLAVEIEVDQWYDAKPISFKPVFYNAADITSDRPFPTLYFVASVPGKYLFTLTFGSANISKLSRCSITTQPRLFCIYVSVMACKTTATTSKSSRYFQILPLLETPNRLPDEGFLLPVHAYGPCII